VSAANRRRARGLRWRSAAEESTAVRAGSPPWRERRVHALARPDLEFASGGPNEPEEHLQARGLAGAVGAEQTVNRAARH
jgi:hypothetical protein